MHNFPQELIDKIVDFVVAGITDSSRKWSCSFLPSEGEQIPLGGTPNVVGDLGLVCKQWWPRSRFHMFSYVVLRPGRVHSFFDLVDSSRSGILRLIQTLHLEFRGLRLLDEHQLSRFQESCNLTGLLIWIPGWSEAEGFQYTRFSSLEFHASILGSVVPSISSLVMTFERIPLNTAIRTPSFFPNLATLSLSGDEILAGSSDPVVPPVFPPIHTLRFKIREDGAEGYFNYLSLQNIPRLKALELDLADENTSGAVAYYFRKSGGAIRHLELCGIDSSRSSPALLHLALQSTPNLQRLCVDRRNQPPPILDVISAVSSHSLVEFRFRFFIGTKDGVPTPWHHIDAALAGDQFGALTDFHVYTPIPYPIDLTALPKVREAMPLATARGIVPDTVFF
ncbi:hypothetical protein B0H11DRAFT_2198737 [Mycena galericulata]|nr:hypothetical protein B0H11DRAFT_2198737 [Mycena galericulata]